MISEKCLNVHSLLYEICYNNYPFQCEALFWQSTDLSKPEIWSIHYDLILELGLGITQWLNGKESACNAWYSEEYWQKKNTASRLRETHHLIFLVDVQEVIYLWKAIWQELLKNKIKVSDLCSCCIVSEWKGERQTQNMALNRPLQNPTQGMRH